MGRQQILYIAVSVGRCHIDGEDTISIQIKGVGERGIMSQGKVENETNTAICVVDSD